MSTKPTRTDHEAAPSEPAAGLLGESGHLRSLGGRIRSLRSEHQLTLQAIAERTGLSPSMISMVERGQTSPSIGTLVAISSALGVRVGDLFDFDHSEHADPVVLVDEQDTVTTRTGVLHRAAVVALTQGLGLNVNEYPVGASSADEQLHHSGFECGVVLEGSLRIQLEDNAYTLQPGDSIAYQSTIPHRISNAGDTTARAVWVNLDR